MKSWLGGASRSRSFLTRGQAQGVGHEQRGARCQPREHRLPGSDGQIRALQRHRNAEPTNALFKKDLLTQKKAHDVVVK